jgi:hypothetical protein
MPLTIYRRAVEGSTSVFLLQPLPDIQGSVSYTCVVVYTIHGHAPPRPVLMVLILNVVYSTYM